MSFLETPDHLVERIVEVVHIDGSLIAPRRDQSSLIAHVRDFCTSKTRCHFGKNLCLDRIIDLDMFQVYFKNLSSSVEVRPVDTELSVKPSGAQKRIVQYIRSVGCCHEDDPFVARESIHLHKKLVEGVFYSIISPLDTVSSPGTPDRIDLIDKYDTRCFFPCLSEKIPDTRCTHSNKHFHKVRSTDAEKRNVCFPGNCFCQKSFSCTRRAYQ